MQVFEEHHLLDKARLGNPAALEKLVATHSQAAFTLAMRILRHREEAEEVVQDAFTKAFASLGQFRGQSRFSTWLYRIVYTTALNCAARKRPQHQELDMWTEECTDLAGATERFELLELAERKHFTDLALQTLTPEERGMVTLHYYEDRPLAEIAEITGLTPANVKIKLYRARQKLAAALETLLGKELDLWKSRT